MTQKNRFENAIKDVDDKFKKIEERNAKLNRVSKVEAKPDVSPTERREKKLKEEQLDEKVKIENKLKKAGVVFLVGQALMIPAYMNHPTLIPQIFLFGSFSLGIICLAVIDYT